jgi:hypothetical protein
MQRAFLLASLLALNACTSSVHVPAEKYGLLFRLGEIKQTAPGPATLDKVFMMEHVILIDKEYTIELNNGQYVVRYEVVDPGTYFQTVHGNDSILGLLEKELARQSLRGNATDSQAKLHTLIESMKLPIKVLRVTKRAAGSYPS